MLSDYLVIGHWLLIAIGAALLGGTGLALLQYRRTGSFPGQPTATAEGQPARISPRTAAVKCLIGAVLILWGSLSLMVG